MEVTKEINPHFEAFLFDWGSKIYFLVGAAMDRRSRIMSRSRSF